MEPTDLINKTSIKNIKMPMKGQWKRLKWDLGNENKSKLLFSEHVPVWKNFYPLLSKLSNVLPSAVIEIVAFGPTSVGPLRLTWILVFFF